jgi:hypothetical protein
MELSKKEQATLINALWDSLRTPPWTKDKDKLIDFGKMIFANAKVPLKDMENRQFEKLFPYLAEIASGLGERILGANGEVKVEKKDDEVQGEKNEKNEEKKEEEHG